MSGSSPKTIIGYHGTSIRAAEKILKDGFEVSRNDYDWLGDGVYFWEGSRERALDWATQRYGMEAAVVVANVELVDCMDLLDLRWSRVLSQAYDGFVTHLRGLGLPLPRQTSGAHRLDRAVINYAVAELRVQGVEIRCVRGCFPEGQPIYPNSAILDKAHIQVCVLDQGACIRDIRLDS